MDSFGKTFTGERGVENSLLLAGLLAPRFTFGPGARQRLDQGGGTGIRDSLIVLSQILGGQRQERAGQEGINTAFEMLSGKQPITSEAIKHLPPQLVGQMLARVGEQAENERFQLGLEGFETDRRARTVPSIMPGAAPSNVAPYTQEMSDARDAFTAPPKPPPVTIEDLTRLASLGERGQRFGEMLYKTQETSAYREEQNQIKREMQQITKEAREAANSTKMYEIEKRYEGLQATLASKMELQTNKLTSDMEKLAELITAKHEDVATQEQGRTQRVGTQEAGKSARQTERITAPPKPPKPGASPKQTESDKAVEAYLPKFRVLTTYPDREERARQLIESESQLSPSRRSMLQRAYKQVQQEWAEMTVRQGQSRPHTPTQNSSDPMEGRTATGPGGQKIIYRNGQWEPVNAR